MPKTAFIILKTPQEQDPTHIVGRFAGKADAVAILLEDGVYQALRKQAADKLRTSFIEVLVSREDFEARGFTSSDLNVGKPAEYSDIIDWIMERTDRTVTI